MEHTERFVICENDWPTDLGIVRARLEMIVSMETFIEVSSRTDIECVVSALEDVDVVDFGFHGDSISHSQITNTQKKKHPSGCFFARRMKLFAFL